MYLHATPSHESVTGRDSGIQGSGGTIASARLSDDTIIFDNITPCNVHQPTPNDHSGIFHEIEQAGVVWHVHNLII